MFKRGVGTVFAIDTSGNTCIGAVAPEAFFHVDGETLIQKTSATAFTVASIGIGIVLRNILSMVFGDFPDKRGSFGGLCDGCTYYSSFPEPIAGLLKLIPFYDAGRGQFIITFSFTNVHV